MRGEAYDAADRPVAKYFYAPAASSVSVVTTSYDASGNAGLVASIHNAVGDTTTFPSYDAEGRPLNISFTNGSISTQTPNRSYAYNLNGDLLTIATAAYGTQSYTYDGDENVLTSTEPSGGSGGSFTGSGTRTSPATLTYHYYPDDSLASMDAKSAALTLTNLREYNYRPDGLLHTTYSGIDKGSYTENYTTAGRPLNALDPYHGGAYSMVATYDAYGQLSGFTIPAGSYTNFAHDPRGLVTSMTLTNGVSNLLTQAVSYTSRGELLATTAAKYADGYLVPANEPVCYDWGKYGQFESCGTTTYSFDARASAPTGASYVPNPGASIPPSYVERPGTLTYDGEGRQKRDQFDAEDHIMSLSNPNASTSNVAWNPDGHQGLNITYCGTICQSNGGSGSNNTYHWDGDDLLFATGSSGAITDARIGPDVDGTGAGANISASDFDPFGNVVSHHNPTGYDAWQATDFTGDNAGAFIAGGSKGYTPGVTGLFYNDTSLGTRQYDPQFNAWTSTDALDSITGDPTTELPYAYANNNPTVYSDPSGMMSTHAGPAPWDTLWNELGGEDFGNMYSAVGPVNSDFFLGAARLRQDPNAPLRVIAHVRARSRTHPNVAAPHNPLVMVFGTFLQLFGGMPSPGSIQKNLNIPERFTYQWTKFDRTTGEATSLRFQDPKNAGNSVRLSIKEGNIYVRLVKGTSHYDQEGNMLQGKPGIGIPLQQFGQVPEGFFPQ